MPRVSPAAVTGFIVQLGLLAQPSQHAYFDRLKAMPEAIYAYSMRSQAELDQQVHGKGPSTSITYDFANDPYPKKQDAAKVVVPANLASIPKQVRFDTRVSTGTVIFTWDAWWGREYLSTGSLLRHKTFMVASPHDNSSRWINHMTRYNLGSSSEIGRADYVISSARYGRRVGEGREEVLIPKRADFYVRAETWTRYWTMVEFVPDGFDRLSFWMADEKRDPMQIYRNVEVDSAGLIDRFWLEYNSSQNRKGPPLVAYVKNLIVLQNVANPVSLMQRP